MKVPNSHILRLIVCWGVRGGCMKKFGHAGERPHSADEKVSFWCLRLAREKKVKSGSDLFLKLSNGISYWCFGGSGKVKLG